MPDNTPLDTLEEPTGKNNLTSRAMFVQRKNYTNSISREPELLDKFMDFHGKHALYGKYNESGRIIHVSEKNLKQLPTGDGETHYLLNFVVDAFIALRDRVDFLVSQGVLEEGTPLTDMRVSNSWNSVHKQYHDFASNVLYKRFLSFLTFKKLDKKIVDFDSHLRVFMMFLASELPSMPFTRSHFIASKYCTPLASGLVLELSSDNHGDDEVKYQTYIKDKNLPMFQQMALSEGFLLDKAAPWRLVCDLNSPPMIEAQEIYGISGASQVIDRMFYRTQDYDIDLMKMYIMGFYNSFVNSNPILRKPVFAITEGAVATKIKQIQRQTVTLEEINSKYDAHFWLRMYLYVRGMEHNVPWNQYEFEKRYRNAVYAFIDKGFDVSVEYINRNCMVNNRSHRKERCYSIWDPVKMF
jgi:hypothetical protein